MAKQRNPVEQIEFVRNLLAFLLVGSFIGAMGAFTFWVIPAANKDILTYMVGQLSGMALTVLSFYFIDKVGQAAIDAKRTDNTGKMAEAIKEVARSGSTTESEDVIRSGDDVSVTKGEDK